MPAEPTTLNVEPLATFRFEVDVGGFVGLGIFTECKLPDVEWDIHEQKEGGLNEYVHQLPGQRKAGKVTLKHGITKKFEFMKWYGEMMQENFTEYQKTVTITLLNAEHKPLMRWSIDGAYPTKITWPELKTADNVVAIQSLELACGRIEFEPNPA